MYTVILWKSLPLPLGIHLMNEVHSYNEEGASFHGPWVRVSGLMAGFNWLYRVGWYHLDRYFFFFFLVLFSFFSLNVMLQFIIFYSRIYKRYWIKRSWNIYAYVHFCLTGLKLSSRSVSKKLSPCMNDGFRIVHLPAAFRCWIWLRFSTLVILAILKNISGMIYVETDTFRMAIDCEFD